MLRRCPPLCSVKRRGFVNFGIQGFLFGKVLHTILRFLVFLLGILGPVKKCSSEPLFFLGMGNRARRHPVSSGNQVVASAPLRDFSRGALPVVASSR